MADALKKDSIDSFFDDWLPDVDFNMKSSLAPEIEQPQPKREPPKKPERKIRVLPSAKPAVRRKRDFSKVLFLCSAVVLLVGALGVVTTYSEVYSRKAQIQALNEELEEAKELTMILSEAPELEMSMMEVYEYATEELGMVEATSEDTVFIQPQPHSYTQVTEPVEDSGDRVTFHWFS